MDITFDPESGVSFLYSTIEQTAEEMQVTSCKGNTDISWARILHSLIITNLGAPQMLRISYTLDAATVRNCQDADPGSCLGGKLKHSTFFPNRDQYWRGQKKTITQPLCWNSEPTEPDFNLQINISAIYNGTDTVTDEITLDDSHDHVEISMYVHK